MQAESPHLDHRSLDRGERGQIVDPGGIARPGLSAARKKLIAKSADHAIRSLDQKVPERPVKPVHVLGIAKGEIAQRLRRADIGASRGHPCAVFSLAQ